MADSQDQAPAPQITEQHFRVLRQFGRSNFQRQMTATDRDTLWRMACQQARIAPLPLDTVVAEWHRFIQGSSAESGLAMNGDIDPAYVTIGVLHRGLVQAAHTMPTRNLLIEALRIHARTFSDREAFLTDVLRCCQPQPEKTT